MFGKITRLAKKIHHYGVSQSCQIVYHRVKQKINAQYWRLCVKNNGAKHTWDDIKKIHSIDTSINKFLESFKLRSLNLENELYSQKINKKEIISQADLFVKKCFDLLGSDLQCFTQIPWHRDFRLQAQNSTVDVQFDVHNFYQDIPIHIFNDKEIKKDIKVPWELSRCYHFLVLGQAYQLTNDESYVKVFVEQTTDWLDNNPYLQGVNWVCPMEVALRAINWIVAFEYFKNSKNLSSPFQQRFILSLYDHFIYLENNWEVFDGKTSNHYLSDLVGYLYLCWFFKELPGVEKKLHWVAQEIFKEIDKQIFDEGTDYESTTNYHQLVCELLLHAQFVLKECDIVIPQNIALKIERMIEFISWCTPENGQLISIGDNDSGRVLFYGLPQSLIKNKKTYGEKKFKQFGLSIIKTKKVHVSLRHYFFNKQSPTAHVHNDVNSITLAINGIPVIVDPGSFVYTPSVYWRNYFRSIHRHNSFYYESEEPNHLDEKIFYLKVKENIQKFNRTISYKEDCLELIDIISPDAKNNIVVWNFTLAPYIEAQQKNNECYFYYEKKLLATMQSDLDFTFFDGLVSFTYGSKQKTVCLKARKKINSQKKFKTKFNLI